MIGLDRFDHVALAVRDLGAAAELYGELMGGTLVRGGDDLELGIRTMQFKYPPGIKVELLTPIGQSYLAAYLDRHGEGFHHATVFVDDLRVTIDVLAERGYELVDVDLSMDTWQEAFVRPRSGFGALLQLVCSTLDWSQPVPGMTVESILAGEWRWLNNTCIPTAEVESQGLTSVRPPKNFASKP